MSQFNSNEFFDFDHTFVPSIIEIWNKEKTRLKLVKLGGAHFDPEEFYEHNYKENGVFVRKEVLDNQAYIIYIQGEQGLEKRPFFPTTWNPEDFNDCLQAFLLENKTFIIKSINIPHFVCQTIIHKDIPVRIVFSNRTIICMYPAI